jgi:hypothetical protein
MTKRRMEHISLNKDQLDQLPPGSVVVANVGGSDDVYTNSGEDILRMYREDGNPKTANPKLSEALDWYMQGMSGNAADVLVAQYGPFGDNGNFVAAICKADLDW